MEAKSLVLPEVWLHYLFKTKQFNPLDLRTEDGQALELLDLGQYNAVGAGPDFKQAKIRLDGLLWVGDIELHWQSSAWRQHGHDRDPNYEAVILHVVYEDNAPNLRRADGSLLPCLSLGSRIAGEVLNTCAGLMASGADIPCSNLLKGLEISKAFFWAERLGVERLMERALWHEEMFDLLRQDMEAGFFFALARGFAWPDKVEAMERLCRAWPFELWRRYGGNLFQLRALLFGHAGLLGGEGADDLSRALRKEYDYLLDLHGLERGGDLLWPRAKMRPSNAIDFRLAQFSLLWWGAGGGRLLGAFLAVEDLEACLDLLDIELDAYWLEHYRLGLASKRRRGGGLSLDLKRLILVNALLPFLWALGKRLGREDWQEKALSFFEALPAEDNHILRRWADLGLVPKSACQAQGLMQLYKHYCRVKACASCGIGHQLLREKP